MLQKILAIATAVLTALVAIFISKNRALKAEKERAQDGEAHASAAVNLYQRIDANEAKVEEAHNGELDAIDPDGRNDMDNHW